MNRVIFSDFINIHEYTLRFVQSRPPRRPRLWSNKKMHSGVQSRPRRRPRYLPRAADCVNVVKHWKHEYNTFQYECNRLWRHVSRFADLSRSNCRSHCRPSSHDSRRSWPRPRIHNGSGRLSARDVAEHQSNLAFPMFIAFGISNVSQPYAIALSRGWQWIHDHKRGRGRAPDSVRTLRSVKMLYSHITQLYVLAGP